MKHIKNCKRHPPQVVLYPELAVKGMAPIENDGSGDEFHDEYDDILNQIELAEMRAADRENGISDGEADFKKVSVNLNDGELNRPYKFNTLARTTFRKIRVKFVLKIFGKRSSFLFVFISTSKVTS